MFVLGFIPLESLEILHSCALFISIRLGMMNVFRCPWIEIGDREIQHLQKCLHPG